MKSWITGGGPDSNIILSSRVRLARNISNIPFPSVMEQDKAEFVMNSVKDAVITDQAEKYYSFIIMQHQKPLDKQTLVEKHLISPGLLKNSQNSAVIIDEDEITSIMINEEDHIRIQAILPGLQIKKAWEIGTSVDDVIEEKLEYAYDESLGYLTCCPTNVGTGIRASVMVHLPALNITGNISKILQAVSQIGLTIRGLYGEGTEIVGNIFQISNQITLGRAEEEIVDNLSAVTTQIIEKEKEARNLLLNNNRVQIEDKVWRSWGIMKNARVMHSQECMKLLSDIRLGVDLKILDTIPISALNEIMIYTQPASLQKSFQAELNASERDVYRAEMIRSKLV